MAAIARGAMPIVAARGSLPALAINVVVAFAGWLARTVTTAGAITGAVIGIAVYLGTGWQGWTLLFTSFVAAAVATRLGYRRKALVGHRRRRAADAAARATRSPTPALRRGSRSSALGMPQPRLSRRLAMVAALVTAASDTVASEVGKAVGQDDVAGRRDSGACAPGTSGAVSRRGHARRHRRGAAPGRARGCARH